MAKRRTNSSTDEVTRAVSRRSVLETLGSGGLLAGLAGCTENNGTETSDGEGTDGGGSGSGEGTDETGDEDGTGDDGGSTRDDGGDDDGEWFWADPTHDSTVDQADVDLAGQFVSGDKSPSTDQRRVTDLARPCGELTDVDTRMVDAIRTGGCVDLDVGVECWPFKDVLVPDGRRMEFGELAADETVDRTLSITNEGDRELEVEFSLVDHPGMELADGSQGPTTLSPGESTDVTVELGATGSGVIGGMLLAAVDGHTSWIAGATATVPPDLEAQAEALHEDIEDPSSEEVI